MPSNNLCHTPVDSRSPASHNAAMAALEIWGGHECSLNRIGDAFRDQTVLSGHQDRLDDLDRFAELGLRALRYPALWERTEVEPGARDFRWLDARLARLAELRVRPILTLVHHGSGPSWTDLLDDSFAPGLAAHAAAVARRYPDVCDYTPVNEPLTTARFSALYGLWHPHARDAGLFWRAFLNQIDAVRLCMRAIRQERADARLVQTEDLGFCQSTPRLAPQAAFENERRWLTWDLLCGRVTPGHPLHAHIAGHGLGERLARIADDPCPPGVIGINHYVTSDRFLDEAVGGYPPRTHGGNGETTYADVEAVRVAQAGDVGFGALLDQAWRRYRLPLALTECHIGSTTDEQARWLLEALDAAHAARAAGIDVLAITAWSLLGAYGWNTLLTAPGLYESGVFDLASGHVQPTDMACLLKTMANHEPMPPRSSVPAWWRDEDARVIYKKADHRASFLTYPAIEAFGLP